MATKRDFVISNGLQTDKSGVTSNTLVVDSVNDKVGIGTGATTPGALLDVQGAAAIGTGTVFDNSFATLILKQRPAADGYASLSFQPTNTNFIGKIDAVNASNSLEFWTNKNSTTGSRFVLNFGATEYISLAPKATEVLRINDGGSVYINGTAGFSVGTSTLTTGYTDLRTNLRIGAYSKTGTYTNLASGTTVTITVPNHGLTTGDSIYIDYTAGTAVDEYYNTLTVVDANTFTVQASVAIAAANTAQTCTIFVENQIRFAGQRGDGGTTPSWDHAVISERLYGASDKSELLIFKGNDSGTSIPDNIRLAATGDIYLHTGFAGGGMLYSGYITSFGNSVASSTLSILASGNVGIGNSNPGAKLDVTGDIRLSAADPEIEFNTGGPRLKVPSANTLTIHTGGGLNTTTGEVVRITGTGVGIISTTNPVSSFQVRDTLTFETTTTTVTTTSQVAIDSFAIANFRSAKYHVQLTCPGQIATLGSITNGGRGYTAGTFNATFTTSSGTGGAAQGTVTISNGTVATLTVLSGGTGYTAGDVLTASGGSGLQFTVSTVNAGVITAFGAITNAGINYTAGTLTLLGGTGTGATATATIYDGVVTSVSLLQQPTTGTGGTIYYSGSNYTTGSVLSLDRTALANTITTIAGSPSTFTSLTVHGLVVNDIIRVTGTANGLTAGVDYYVVATPTTTTFTLGTSIGVAASYTAGTSLAIGFYRNSSANGGQVAYTNAISAVATNYQVSDILVLHNGTTTDFVEYAGIANNDILGSFSTDISGANARLLLTPTYPNNTVKVVRQAVTV